MPWNIQVLFVALGLLVTWLITCNAVYTSVVVFKWVSTWLCCINSEVKPNWFHIFLKMSSNKKTVVVENLVESRHTVMILPCVCRLPTWRGRHSTDSTSSTVRSPTANLTLACNHCCTLPLRPSLGSQAGSGLAPMSPTIKTTLYRPLRTWRGKLLQLSGRATLSPSQSCSHIQMMTATLPTTIHTPTPCCKYVPHAISFPTPILDKWAQSV